MPEPEPVRAAELIATLCLATDLGVGLPFEHGLQSTRVAMRLGERLGIDATTASQTYYACLLFYSGCTADAEISAEIFTDDTALNRHFAPVMFGAPAELMMGIVRALAPPTGAMPARALHAMRRLPRALSGHRRHLAAQCEVAQMLTNQLGLPAALEALWLKFTERWDGKGVPGRVRGAEIPLPARIVHVARDAAFQCTLGGTEFAARVIRERAGDAFDPEIARLLADRAPEILAADPTESAWDEVLAFEPSPRLVLQSEAVDRALAAMGDFADLVSPYLVGHSAGVAELATQAAGRMNLAPMERQQVRRAALVHDVGRVAVPARIWQKAAPLTPDEWERVRLHAYQSERVLSRSPFLAGLCSVATTHHERCDGSGYHRGISASGLTRGARVLAAADAYHAMTEARPYRAALASEQAARALGEEARAGRLEPDAVSAVLEAAGQRTKRLVRPAGLTEREAEVVGLVAHGLQTKQVARRLGISVKTADRHIQNAYGKIGVSTRAAAALFAMQHGLAAWGELPIARPKGRP
jgi:HD-GYP domain-containing protein (c-di-GMP phosphodiesterase class II)